MFAQFQIFRVRERRISIFPKKTFVYTIFIQRRKTAITIFLTSLQLRRFFGIFVNKRNPENHTTCLQRCFCRMRDKTPIFRLGENCRFCNGTNSPVIKLKQNCILVIIQTASFRKDTVVQDKSGLT